MIDNMEVIRTCCPICIQETSKEIVHENDTSHYEESIKYKICSYHPDNATQKLLSAIFGDEEK